MIFKMVIYVLFLLSCSNSKIKEKHRYLIVDEIFSSGKMTPEKINVIYEIFGKPEGNIKIKGVKYLYRYIAQTADAQYSLTVKDGKILSFLLIPSERHRKYFKIDDALKILPHLKLKRSERLREEIHHMIGKVFTYRSRNNRFEIQTNSSGRVEQFVWNIPSQGTVAVK